MAHDVFISYSSKDKPVADAVCAGLEQKGIRCWIAPRDILPGTAWSESIVNAIRDSKVLVIIFSSNSNQSSQVFREVERAIASDVVILPFRIENIVPSDRMVYFLGSEHWLDALTPPLEDHIRKLAHSIQQLLSLQAPKDSIPSSPPVQAPAPASHPVLAPAAPSKPARVGPFALWQAGLLGFAGVACIGVLVVALILVPKLIGGGSSSPTQTSALSSGAPWLEQTETVSAASPITASESTPQAPTANIPLVQSSVSSSWRRTADLPRKINDCVVDPSNPQILYCGTGGSGSGAGVYKSEDGGLTWQLKAEGLPMADILSLAIGADSVHTLYAATSDKVYASRDGAQTWETLGSSDRMFAAEMRIYAAPGEDPALYHLAFANGILRSTDGGQNWQPATSGLPLDADNAAHVTSLAIDPSNPQVLYAGTGGYSGEGHGVYKSTDGGQTWAPANQGMIDYRIISLAVDPAQPDTLYAAADPITLFKSQDGGSSWTEIQAPLPDYGTIIAVRLDPQTPGRIYVLLDGEQGLFYSPDGGSTWQAVGKPGEVDYPSFTTLAVIPGEEPRAFLGTRERGGWLFGSSLPTSSPNPTPPQASSPAASEHLPSGTWQEVSGLPRQVNALAADPSAPSIIYAGTGKNGSGSGVYKSTDGGLTWINSSSGLEPEDIIAVAVSPLENQTIYAATSSDVYVSLDAAANWSKLSQVPFFFGIKLQLLPSPNESSVIFVLADGYSAAFSRDGGQNWEEITDGLPRDSYDKVHVLSLALHPTDSDILYLGTGNLGGDGHGVYKSTDGGLTWTASNQGMVDRRITGIAIDPSNPETVYAADAEGVVFKTFDGGLHWAEIHPGQPNEYLNILDIAIDPTAPRVIYLLCDQIGVLYSPDGGTNWQVSGKPGSIDYPYYSAFGPIFTSPPVLLTGINDSGAWRLGE